MRLLLDTHILIWSMQADPRLTPRLIEAVGAADEVWLSAVTFYEIGIKVAAGRLPAADYRGAAARIGAALLPLTADHAAEAAALPPIHRDPFDRMLVGQARIEGLTIVSADRALARYPVATLA